MQGLATKLLLCLTLLSNIIIIGIPISEEAVAAPSPSVTVKTSGKTLTIEFKNPKTASESIYGISMATDTSIKSFYVPKGWIGEIYTMDYHNDSIRIESDTKLLKPNGTLKFRITTDTMLLNANWIAYNEQLETVGEGSIKNPLTDMIMKLFEFDKKLNDASEHLESNDHVRANYNLEEAQNYLYQAREEYEKNRKNIPSKKDRDSIQSVLSLDDRDLSIFTRTTFVYENIDRVLAEFEKYYDDIDGYLATTTEYEFLGYDYKEIANDLNTYANQLEALIKNKKTTTIAAAIIEIRGYDLEYVKESRESAAAWNDGAEEILSWVDETREYYGVKEDPRNNEIPQGEDIEVFDQNIIPTKLAKFFDTFDRDFDGKIDLSEAQSFFNWVEENIVYRYDDEDTQEPFIGTLVGDGRVGVDYRQTPYETFIERAGDCEDMATLEQAFYNYWDIAAHTVGVNAKSRTEIDHAAAIVLMGGTPEEYQSYLGGLLHYNLSEGTYDVFDNSIPPGYYMLVDNAYSDAFGYLSGGLEEGTFIISCYVPVDQGYDQEWEYAKSKCSIPFN